MSNLYKLKKTTKRLNIKKADKRVLVPAMLGIPIKTVKVPGRPGYHYARIRGNLNETVQAYNPVTNPIYDWPVFLEFKHNRWVVISTNYGQYITWNENNNVAAHGAGHLISGFDPVYITTQQIIDGVVYASSGMNLHLNAGFVNYQNNIVFVQSQNIDMTQYLPTGTGAIWSIVRVNSYGTVSVQHDMHRVEDLTQLTGFNIPAIEHGYIGLAAVKLWHGQTSIDSRPTTSDIVDLRYLPDYAVGSTGSTGSSGGGGHTIQSNGSALAQRTNLNFIGFTVSDDAGNNATKVEIASGSSGGAYAETIGDGIESDFIVTHNLGTKDIIVELWDITGTDPLLATDDADQIVVTSDDEIKITFPDPPDTNAYRVVVFTGGGGGTYAETIGDGVESDFTVTHNLGVKDVLIELWDITGSDPLLATNDADQIITTSDDTVQIFFPNPPDADAYRVVVLMSGGGGGGGGASKFTDLTDAPDSYASQGGKLVAVKSDESGLEFVAESEHDAIKIQGRDVSDAAPNDNQVLGWDAGASTWKPIDQSGGGAPIYKKWDADAPPLTAGADDDEFSDNSFTSWSEFDPNDLLTIVEENDYLGFTQITRAGDNVTGCYKTIPAGDFSIITKVHQLVPNANFFQAGLALWEDPSNVAKGIYTFGLTNGSDLWKIELLRWNHHNSLNAAPYVTDIGRPINSCYFRIRRNSTTYYFDASINGISWKQLYSGNLVFTPTKYGLATNNVDTGVPNMALFEFFRYVDSDVTRLAKLNGRLINVYG